MFTISVCMIIKNESKTLKRILECAKAFADEIIVVDTGSTDNSKEIAKNYTDKVFDFTWVEDFSKARNFSFEKATCDYCMWLDADDFITKDNIAKLEALKQSDANADVFMCKYAVGFNQENVPYMTYFRERILKRSQNFKWRGFVHETIAPEGKIEYTTIEIEHRKEVFSNPKRNLNLYRHALKEGKEFSEREIYYYSRELFYNSYYTKAIKGFKKFLSCKNTYPPDHLGAIIMLSECYLKKNQLEKAKSTLFQAFKTHTPTSEICCRLGEIEDLQNEKERAIFWFTSALNCPAQSSGFVREEYSNIIPYLELTKLWWQIGDKEKARQYFLKGKEIRPNHPSILYNAKFFD